MKKRIKTGVDETLAFEAMRYALEEMRPSERETFERQLLEDQAARKALVDAVAVCEVMKEMFASADERANRRSGELIQPAVNHRAERQSGIESAAVVDGLWQRRAVWASLALAASVMIAVVLSGVGRDRGRHALQLAQPAVGDNSPSLDGMSDSDRMSDRGKQLAVAWLNFLPSPNDHTAQADLLSQTDLFAQTDPDAFESDDPNAAGVADDEVALVDPAGDTTVSPTDDWLYEAVTAPAAETSSPAVAPLEG
ncbi:MAG: hypothetical protein ACREHD_27270 [Pirellulales bacterium]